MSLRHGRHAEAHGTCDVRCLLYPTWEVIVNDKGPLELLKSGSKFMFQDERWRFMDQPGPSRRESMRYGKER